MGTEDFTGYRAKYERQKALLDEADIADVDREAIRSFVNARSGQDELSSLVNYYQTLRKASERCHRPLLELADEADAEQFWEDLRTNPEYGRGGPLATSTVGTYMEYVRMLLEYHDREWAVEISPDMEDDDEAAVNPNDMLSQEDIADLLDAADRQRDVAFIEFLADTAARLGLAGSLRVRDVDLDGERATYTPNDNALGLKGAAIQPYPIIDARAPMRTYLRQSHPRPDEPDAAFFHNFRPYFGPIEEDDGASTPNNFRQRLEAIAEDAGVDKPVNPHNFKHSAVTRMAREGYDREQIRHRVHWSVDTDMWDVYLHLDAEEVNDDIFAAAGIGEADESDRRRARCGNCATEIAPHHRHCPSCGAAASQPRQQLIDMVEEYLIEEMVTADSTKGRRELDAYRRHIKQNPEDIPDEARRLFQEADG